METTRCHPATSPLPTVKKAWGREVILVNNELYCAKYLFVAPGWQCSLHRHLLKDETFLVLDGAIRLEVGNDRHFLFRNDRYRIHRGTWHRFANLESTDTCILEVSTHHDDADVERKEPSMRTTSLTSSEDLHCT